MNVDAGGAEGAGGGAASEAGPAAAGGGEAGVPPPPQPPRPAVWAFVREIQVFVVGFLTSLMPGFQAPDAPLGAGVDVGAIPNQDGPHED